MKRRILLVFTALVVLVGCSIQKDQELLSKKYNQLPSGSVKPLGWLEATMRSQGNGITGHLHEIRQETFRKTWDDRASRSQNSDWWAYEQQAYWFDGLIQLAYILNDPKLTSLADEFVTKALAGQTADGYMGGWPNHPYQNTDIGDVYVQGQLFNALISYYEATQDPRIIPALQKGLLHIYANCKPVPDKDGKMPDAWWGGSCNWPSASHIIQPCLWVYSKTGDKQILDLANLTFTATQVSSRNTGWDNAPADIRLPSLLSGTEDFRSMHGVDVALLLRIPALHYLVSGNIDELQASIYGLRKTDNAHVHVHGGLAGDEPLGDPTAVVGTETCEVLEYCLTKQTLFSITDDSRYVDDIEKMIFNTFQGATRKDGKAIQYFSYPNSVAQVYLPDASLEVLCCVGEWGRIYPNYVNKVMWLASQDKGLALAGYGPSSVSAKVGAKNQSVSFMETTNYPFDENVHLAMTSSESVKFPLYLRIPGWCQEATIRVNGKPLSQSLLPGRMVKIERLWSKGDSVDIQLPMHVAFSRWDKLSVAVERGPLVYALKIEEEWRKSGERTPGFPDWEVRAASPWNYALCLRLCWTNGKISRRRLDNGKSEVNTGDSYFKVNRVQIAEGADPWANPPIELIARAKKVDSWKLENPLPAVLPQVNEHAAPLTPDVPQSPVLTNNPEEEITLVPYGCTHVRVTYFPVTPIGK